MIDIELKSNKKIINLKTLEWIYSGNMVRAGVNKVIDEHQLAPQPEMICRTARPFEALNASPPIISTRTTTLSQWAQLPKDQAGATLAESEKSK